MKTRLYLCVILLFASTFCAGNYGDAEVSEVTSIYDGDTFRVNISGWPAVVGERIPIRVLGIDTPELRGACNEEKILARKAKQFTVALLRGAERISLHNIERGKYFRLLADVYVDGVSLGDELIRNGFAVKYNGKKKPAWCS